MLLLTAEKETDFIYPATNWVIKLLTHVCGVNKISVHYVDNANNVANHQDRKTELFHICEYPIILFYGKELAFYNQYKGYSCV